jgi:hypothetical protein
MTASKPGRVADTSRFLQPRIAVMKNTSVDQLLLSKKAINSRIIFQKLKYSGLRISKYLVGNERYEKIRWFLLGDNK